jgi:hypothetical protein
MNDEPISWSVTARVYWTIVWRSTALLFAIALPFNFFLTWLFSSGRISFQNLLASSKVFAALALLCVGFVTVNMALRKRYGTFKIRIDRDPT